MPTICAEILRFHRHRLRALCSQDDATKRLRALVQIRGGIVDERTRLCNELTSLLRGYYPQAITLTGTDRHTPLSLEFLHRWPDLETLQKVKPETLRKFYHKNQVRRPEVIEIRIALVQKAKPLSTERILIETSILRLRCILAQLRALEPHLKALDEEIKTVFKAHEDCDIFQSLPGAGTAMAPRLCALFGTDRERWSDASQLQKYYGIAPVIEASGKQRWVHWRWNAPTFDRQSLVEWAGCTVRSCAWAKAYYTLQRQRGKAHSAVLRTLAFKWLRILFRCWRTRTPYDDALYLQQLKAKSSPLLKLITA